MIFPTLDFEERRKSRAAKLSDISRGIRGRSFRIFPARVKQPCKQVFVSLLVPCHTCSRHKVSRKRLPEFSDVKKHFLRFFH
jgi:hypothetical protein